METDKTFFCDGCKLMYYRLADWSDEQAEEETRAIWGDIPKDKRRILCEDCFRFLMKTISEAQA